MLKLFSVLIHTIGITLLGLLPGNNVSITVNAPRNINAGSSFNVEVTLKKGNLKGFARFQQQLPLGLEAELVEVTPVDFTFEQQKVKFVWLQLPANSKIKLTYRVKVNERLKGSFTLKGQFAYIENNTRKVVDAEALNITITPSTRIDPKLIVDIHEFQDMIPAQSPVSMLASRVRCIRQAPVPYGEGNDLLVNLLVNKGKAGRFAKIEEIIPEGYTAEAIESGEAIFTFEDQKVKFLWMNLPPTPRFTVSYRLIPTDGKGEVTVTINGKFSYVIGEATRVIDIIQKDVDLKNLSTEDVESLIASTVTTVPPASSGQFSSSFTGSDGGIEIPIRYQKIESKPAKAKRKEFIPNPLTPEKGIYYRVQVAAGHRPIRIKKYFARLNLTYEVRTEKHQGWYKYSIGSFRQYKEARDFRIRIWNTTKITDAFVAAYNNGRRITVQEALMITNQQWYR